MEFVLRQSSTTRSFSGGKSRYSHLSKWPMFTFPFASLLPQVWGMYILRMLISLGFKVHHVLGDMAHSNQTPICEGPGDSTCLT